VKLHAKVVQETPIEGGERDRNSGRNFNEESWERETLNKKSQDRTSPERSLKRKWKRETSSRRISSQKTHSFSLRSRLFKHTEKLQRKGYLLSSYFHGNRKYLVWSWKRRKNDGQKQRFLETRERERERERESKTRTCLVSVYFFSKSLLLFELPTLAETIFNKFLRNSVIRDGVCLWRLPLKM
jgi:hypothetical protein